MASAELDRETHRELGVALFNRTWELLDLESRTADQADEMIHTAHASRHHWGQTGLWPQMSVGEWQCSRVYAVLGRAEPALWHARRCLDLCEEHGIGDYRLAAAYEAIARAEMVAGDVYAARAWKTKGFEACAAIAEEDDQKVILDDLESLQV